MPILGREAFVIAVVFVMLLPILIVVLGTTTNLSGTKSNQSKLSDADDSRQNIPINSTIVEDFGPLVVVKMAEWGGRPAKEKLDPLELPANKVIISHTAGYGCDSLETCKERAQVVQSFHMDSWNWSQVGYNFMVGGDGRVYEGRGWDYLGSHTKGYNHHSIGISFLGTFTKEKPKDRQLKACQLLLEEGVLLGKLDPNYKLFGHRQLSATDSPGKMLYNIIQKWPHWAYSPDNDGGGSILRFVDRPVWLARPPLKKIPDLELPVGLVIVMPTNSDICTTQAACVFRVRFLQSYDIESIREDDIAYNFLIGGDGNVYVGRGWDQMGAHMAAYNSRSLSLALIGSFQTQKPSPKQLSVTKLLIQKGVELGKIAHSYRLTGASILEPSVGSYKADALYQSFSNWTHWS